MHGDKTILVTGATGQQGGAVVRALLAAGWSVRCLVRDPSKPAAAELRLLDADVVQGDLDDPVSLDRACAGCHGAFSVQTPYTPQGVHGEIAQGKRLADAARRAGVAHFVYSSVGSADRGTGVPHFESKRQIEEYVRALNLPATILRPTFFMENFATYFRPSLENNVYVVRMPVKPATRLAMIAVADIGAFAAIAFDDPGRYVGLALDLGGSVLTLPEAVARMQGRFQKHFAFEELPLDAIRRTSEDLALMFEWFNAAGQTVDLADLRARHPGLMSFVDWLDRSGWDPTR